MKPAFEGETLIRSPVRGRSAAEKAFFTRFTLTEDHQFEAEYTGVYETIMDPGSRLHIDEG